MYKTYNDILELLKKKNFQNRINKLAKKYQNKKIIIYGAGVAFDAISDNFDLSKLNIIGVSDIKFKDDGVYKSFTTYAPESIAAQKPDAVLISMYEYEIAEDYFVNNLFPVYGEFRYENFIKFTFFELLKSFFDTK